jgi:hypothetical protein
MFVELRYDVGAPTPARMTTAVRVIPDRLPFAGADLTQPATISVSCTAPSMATAKAAERQAQRYFGAPADAPIPAPWLNGTPSQATSAAAAANDTPPRRGNIRRSGMELTLRLPPVGGRLRATAKVVTAWLEKQGCREFAYALHAGME